MVTFPIPWNDSNPWVSHCSSDLMKLVGSVRSADCGGQSQFHHRAGAFSRLAIIRP